MEFLPVGQKVSAASLPVVLASDQSTVNVAVVSGGGGGVQYAAGTTAATPTGTVAMGQNPSNVIEPLLVDASGYLEVNVKAGSTGNGAASNTGAAVPAQADYVGFNSTPGTTNLLVGVSSTNPLPVTSVVTGTVAVTQSTSPWVVSLTST